MKQLVNPGLHPRNRYQGHYDLAALIRLQPALAHGIITTVDGRQSLDFSSPETVIHLNQALLKYWYQLEWQLPQGHLCPPIPGRADYLHHLADLLAHDSPALKGAQVNALDIGCGANCIYPLIGQAEYGWRFTGSDIMSDSLQAAQQIIRLNPGLQRVIRLRRQKQDKAIFQGIIQPNERYHLSLSNPPFHDSAHSAQLGSRRKQRQLGLDQSQPLNFAGRDNELWCEGGEVAFIDRMIDESRLFSTQVLWFSCLVSKQAHLPVLQQRLRHGQVPVVKVIPMEQGNKVSRILAWSYMNQAQRRCWLRS